VTVSFQRFAAVIALLATLVFFSAGCRRAASEQWEIVVENKSGGACTVLIDMDAGNNHSNARVDDLPDGQHLSLIVGDRDTAISLVRVTRGGVEQRVEPNLPLTIGKRCDVVVGPDGKPTLSLSSR
jgi:hypothetical protein